MHLNSIMLIETRDTCQAIPHAVRAMRVFNEYLKNNLTKKLLLSILKHREHLYRLVSLNIVLFVVAIAPTGP